VVSFESSPQQPGVIENITRMSCWKPLTLLSFQDRYLVVNNVKINADPWMEALDLFNYEGVVPQFDDLPAAKWASRLLLWL
jgi:hypothetical protein